MMQPGGGTENKQKKKWPGRLLTAVIIIVFLAGISVILYPTFSDWWNGLHQSRVIEEYRTAVETLDNTDYERLFAEAESYNRTLIGKPGRFELTEEEKEEYNRILNVNGTGVIGYVEIPSIDVSLPISHGTSEAVLQVAIGHIEGTSFPIGGAGTHAVISGHRGLPSAKLFSNLDQMKEGDRFTIKVLDRTMTYEVDQIKTILPYETEDLAIDPDEDYCTLMTCTPYSINTHRLLVRGVRVPDGPAAEAAAQEADQITEYHKENAVPLQLIIVPAIALIVVLALILGTRKR